MGDATPALVSGSRALPPLAPLLRLPGPLRDRVHPLHAYLASLAPGSRPTVVSALRMILPWFPVDDLDLLPWPDLRYEHLVALRGALVDRGYAPATVNRCLAAVRGVLRAAWRLRQISTDDYQRIGDVRAVPGSRLPAGRALNRHDLEDLFLACADGTPAGARDAALLVLLFSAGLRRSEAAALPLLSLDREAWAVRVVGKGNREREVPLRGGACQALEAWLARRGASPGYLVCRVTRGSVIIPDGPLSASAIRQRLRVRTLRAGLEACTPHDLRRTFVTHLLDAGIDLNVVRRLAGHAQVQTTARYDRRDDRAGERAVERLQTPFVAAPG